MSFYFSREHHALFAICSMRPEDEDPATYVGQPGWLPIMPPDEAMRRAHKIACQRRYRTSRKAAKATHRFRRAFPDLWAVAVAHVEAIWRDAPWS